jgi:predicted  nucleic acid-binding Zn-ribbon protein
MNDMKLLFELQNCHCSIEKNKVIIKDGSHLYLLKKMKKEFEKCKNNYNEKIQAFGDLKLEYVSTGMELKEIKLQIDKNEYDLYNKFSNDIKSINTLQNKIKNNKAKLKLVEDKAIELLETEEKLKLDIENLKMELMNVKNNFYSYKKDTSEKIEIAKSNVIKVNERIEELQKIISKEHMDIFYSKYEKNKNVVVKLSNGICGGCKMKVSAMTVDEIINKDKLVYCDNCGRILIKEEVKILKEAK